MSIKINLLQFHFFSLSPLNRIPRAVDRRSRYIGKLNLFNEQAPTTRVSFIIKRNEFVRLICVHLEPFPSHLKATKFPSLSSTFLMLHHFCLLMLSHCLLASLSPVVCALHSFDSFFFLRQRRRSECKVAQEPFEH